MSAFTPTPEQVAVVSAARDTKDNLLVSALAGAAKTSTLVLISEAVKVDTLAISFNTRIAKEMKSRLPAYVDSRTLNSLGHKVWSDNKGRRPEVDPGKMYGLVKKLIEDTDNNEDKSFLFDKMGDMLKLCREAKSAGYIPSGLYPEAKALMRDEELQSFVLDEEITDLEWHIFQIAYTQSLKEALGTAGPIRIDFDDQLLMPTVFPVSFPAPALVLVDEAQDLSELNHAMLKKFCRRRIIAVGDENQSIYAFRGAHEDSMNLLKKEFNMTELHLTTSFRCPVSIVELARFRAPAMQYPEWAKPGLVRHLNHWGVDDLPDETTILCRNNSPLFSLAFRLIRNGRYPEIVGSDIGKTLVKMLGKLGPDKMTQADALIALEDWKEEKLLKSRNPHKIEDQAACLKVFIEQGETLSDAKAYAEAILARTGPVKLMTIHKSKGLEWPHVFVLDEDLIDLHETQERNLRYVAVTRAKESLTFIRSDDFRGKEDME